VTKSANGQYLQYSIMLAARRVVSVWRSIDEVSGFRRESLSVSGAINEETLRSVR
jgi:hypothetical protein